MIRVKPCRYGPMAYMDNDVYVGRSLGVYGDYSEAEVRLFRSLLKPGSTVLEIGANIGAHTVPLAQMVGPQGQVYAFEPQRTIYYLLCANIVLNNLLHVVCHQAAAGDASGTISVPEINYTTDNNFGGVDLERCYPGRTYQVPLVRVDDLGLARCDLIKIDVEGMEQRVLKGAVQTIERFRPVLYLEDDRPAKSAALRQFLQALGYEFCVHLPVLFQADNFAGNPNNVFPQVACTNLLCRHRDYVGVGDRPDPFVQVCMEEGKVLLTHHRWTEAEASFRQALSWQGGDVDAYRHLGLALQQQDRLDEAAVSYQYVLQIEPQDLGALDNLGTIANRLAAQNQLDEAIACYEQILRVRPEYAQVHNNLGIALAGKGRLADARACFQQAIRLQQDYADAHRNLAIMEGLQADRPAGS